MQNTVEEDWSQINSGEVSHTDGSLPRIQHISWATPETYNGANVSLGSPVSVFGGYHRRTVLYRYSPDSEPKPLVITTLRDMDAFLICREIFKESFGSGDSRVETNKSSASFFLKGDNPQHVSFYDLLAKVMEQVKTISGHENVKMPVLDLEGQSILYARLIESNTGQIYTSAYNDTNQIDVRTVRDSLTRPAMVFTLVYRDNNQAKLRVQLSQMYVNKSFETFPLALQD